MRPEEFRDHLRRQPFRPFRVVLTDGRAFEVRHPELAILGRTTVAVGMARRGEPEAVLDRMTTVPLADVMRIEPAGSPAQSA